MVDSYNLLGTFKKTGNEKMIHNSISLDLVIVFIYRPEGEVWDQRTGEYLGQAGENAARIGRNGR